ncbi:MAG: hypothetical protein AMJ78_10145 [Omnitrophica WOR_2 bacterium SM23_29]|nr:MAG: hypothetical protein AMJ78_10145 [Omnitrophica WOR_2 bacterium SM23_29]
MRRIWSLNTFGAFDLASSQLSKTDDSAGGVIGVDKTGRIFVLESFMRHDADPLECVEIILGHIFKYKCLQYCIERNRFEFLLPTIERLLEQGYFSDKYDSVDVRRAIGKITNPYTNSKMDNKKERIETTLQPLVKSHAIYLKSTMAKEKQQFSNYMIHDDFLDWLQKAVSISYPPSKEVFQDEGVFRVMDRKVSNKSINEQLVESYFNPWTGKMN